jgi:hypothetical protein
MILNFLASGAYVFLGVKTAGAYSWQPYHLHVPIVYKFWSLNLQESQEPIQACSGKALASGVYVNYVTLWKVTLLN